MLTADERLESVRLKIKWAEHHLSDLHGIVKGFFEGRPYKVRAERHAKSRQPVYYIDSMRSTPFEIPARIGDVIQNLRSALDHLAWHLVEIGCGERKITLTERQLKSVGFPIIDTDIPQRYEANRKVKVPAIRDDTLKKIDALKPYKGGNDALWQLNQLNNVDKHRFLLTAGLALVSISAESIFPYGVVHIFANRDGQIESAEIPGGKYRLIPETPVFPLAKDTELFVDIADAEIDLNDDDKFRFEIAFSEPGIVEAKSILPTLVEFRNLVNRIVLTFRDDLV